MIKITGISDSIGQDDQAALFPRGWNTREEESKHGNGKSTVNQNSLYSFGNTGTEHKQTTQEHK